MTSVGVMASSVATSTCTSVLRESFSNLTAWTNAGATTVTGRTGTAARTSGAGSAATYTIPAASESDTVTVGFAYRTDTLVVDNTVFRVLSDTAATTHVQITLSGTPGQVWAWRGTTNSLGSSSGVIALNTWYYIEVQTRLHDTGGFVTVRVNGTQVLNLTAQDTKNGGTKTKFDAFRITGSNGASQLYDDLYLTTGVGCVFQGDQTIP